MVIGDNAKEHPRWKNIRQNSVLLTPRPSRRRGGSLDLVDLPDAGIKGNSHMMMMDKNSDQVAELIQNGSSARG